MELLTEKISETLKCPYCMKVLEDYTFYANAETLLCIHCSEMFYIEIYVQELQVRLSKI